MFVSYVLRCIGSDDPSGCVCVSNVSDLETSNNVRPPRPLFGLLRLRG